MHLLEFRHGFTLCLPCLNSSDCLAIAYQHFIFIVVRKVLSHFSVSLISRGSGNRRFRSDLHWRDDGVSIAGRVKGESGKITRLYSHCSVSPSNPVGILLFGPPCTSGWSVADSQARPVVGELRSIAKRGFPRRELSVAAYLQRLKGNHRGACRIDAPGVGRFFVSAGSIAELMTCRRRGLPTCHLNPVP